MADPRVLIFDVDLYADKRITKLPNITERRTYSNDKLITNNFQFQCNNIDNYFSTNNSGSIFNGVDWLYEQVLYYDEDNNLIWDGIITDIRCDHRRKTAIIETKDNLFRFRNDYIEYESSDWETGADAIRNIMDQEGFTFYDNKSLTDSGNLLDFNGAYLKCNINKSDNLTLYQAIDKLAIHSAADAYSHVGVVYFKTWNENEENITTSLNIEKINRLRTYPLVNYLEKNIINDYNIDYDGSSDTPITDATGDNIGEASRQKYGTRELEPMQTGTSEQIVFKNIQTAKFIGSTYIKRTQILAGVPRPLIKIQFDLPYDFDEYIDLETKFLLTLPDESWIDKKFEIFEFKKNRNARNINIVAHELV